MIARSDGAPRNSVNCPRTRRPKQAASNRLERRLLEIEKVDPKAKRQVVQLPDTFIEREKLKQRIHQQETRS